MWYPLFLTEHMWTLTVVINYSFFSYFVCFEPSHRIRYPGKGENWLVVYARKKNYNTNICVLILLIYLYIKWLTTNLIPFSGNVTSLFSSRILKISTMPDFRPIKSDLSWNMRMILVCPTQMLPTLFIV